MVADFQKTLTKKNARIAAQKISEKYKKFRKNKLKKPVNLTNIDDADTVAYDENTDLRDVLSTKGAQIAANKISKKYKKMRARTQSFPFNLSDIADAETIDYNDDTNLQDVNMNRNTILAAQKISNKYKNIRRKRKRNASTEPIQIEIKKPKRSKALRITAKKIKEKYKRFRYGR